MAAMPTSFDFDWDTSESEDDFEGFGLDDYDSDINLSEREWSSDDEAPLADIIPLKSRMPDEEVVPNSDDTAQSSWSSTLETVNLEEFTESPGPTTKLSREKSEYDFFSLIFPVTLFQLLADQTNLYARQRQQVKPDLSWKSTTWTEMKAFIGMIVYMSLLELPVYKMYWTRDWLFKTSLSSIMTRPRFEKLLEYFHLNDSTANPARGSDGHDKLHHVRPVLKTIQRTIREQYVLHRNFAIDEVMVAFKGRLGFKQYMPAKPTKFGIKVWERADSTNGYVDRLQIYTGRPENQEGKTEVGLASRVILDLTRDITGSHRYLYCDNFFTSPWLFQRLLDDGIYACGTCRGNRKGFPSQLSKDSVKNKGDFLLRQSGNMVATAWFDNKPVLFLSTNSDPTSFVEVRRKNKNGTDRIHIAPEVVGKYTSNMNAVDRADQLRTQYSCARKSHKWWKYLFFFLLDTAIVNAFILMKESPNHLRKTKTGKTKQRSQLEFRQELCRQLIGDMRVSRKRKRVERHDNIGINHWPEKVKANRCRQCAKFKIRRETSYACMDCKVNLCATCFKPYHDAIVPAMIQEE